MTRTHALCTILAGLHLFLVVCGAIQRPLLPAEHPAVDTLRVYGAVTGSDSTYGFFAMVGPQLQPVFVLTDTDGRTWTETLTDDLNREAALRAGCTTAFLEMPGLSEETRQGLLASWAAHVLSRHPDAIQVVIRVEVYDPPSMAEFQDGKTPLWQQINEFGPYTREGTQGPLAAR